MPLKILTSACCMHINHLIKHIVIQIILIYHINLSILKLIHLIWNRSRNSTPLVPYQAHAHLLIHLNKIWMNGSWTVTSVTFSTLDRSQGPYWSSSSTPYANWRCTLKCIRDLLHCLELNFEHLAHPLSGKIIRYS